MLSLAILILCYVCVVCAGRQCVSFFRSFDSVILYHAGIVIIMSVIVVN